MVPHNIIHLSSWLLVCELLPFQQTNPFQLIIISFHSAIHHSLQKRINVSVCGSPLSSFISSSNIHIKHSNSSQKPTYKLELPPDKRNSMIHLDCQEFHVQKSEWNEKWMTKQYIVSQDCGKIHLCNNNQHIFFIFSKQWKRLLSFFLLFCLVKAILFSNPACFCFPDDSHSLGNELYFRSDVFYPSVSKQGDKISVNLKTCFRVFCLEDGI